MNAVKVYLAGNFALRHKLRNIRDNLQNLGYVITSRWLDVDERPAQNGSAVWEDYAKAWGRRDYEDVLAADVVILDMTIPSSTGGTHVELGLALGCHKKIMFIGDRRTVFHFLEQVVVFKDWDECMAALAFWYPRCAKSK